MNSELESAQFGAKRDGKVKMGKCTTMRWRKVKGRNVQFERKDAFSWEKQQVNSKLKSQETQIRLIMKGKK